jgi:hypothetical protein
MKCEEVESLMIDYLDNTLDWKLREEIEKHLETCERCFDEFKDSQHVMQLMSKDEMVKPGDSMRINFYHMLHSEIKKVDGKNEISLKKPVIPWYNNSKYKIAAGFAILVCGTILGAIINSGMIKSYNSNQIKQLHSELTILKKSAMFTMLKEESSSDRIQAVNYADDFDNPDERVIEVLVNTLNHDKNVNVRMAAAYALAKYAGQTSVSDSLVHSLSVQNDPILQVTLINILVDMKEKRALETIQKIITDKNTLNEVKAVAQRGAHQLI